MLKTFELELLTDPIGHAVKVTPQFNGTVCQIQFNKGTLSNGHILVTVDGTGQKIWDENFDDDKTRCPRQESHDPAGNVIGAVPGELICVAESGLRVLVTGSGNTESGQIFVTVELAQPAAAVYAGQRL